MTGSLFTFEETVVALPVLGRAGVTGSFCVFEEANDASVGGRVGLAVAPLADAAAVV